MTTSQLAKRMGVTQPRISELERAEVAGRVSMESIERAAQAMGCRVVYALVPLAPLGDVFANGRRYSPSARCLQSSRV